MISVQRIRAQQKLIGAIYRQFSYVSEKDLLDRIPYNFGGVKAQINPNSTYKVYQLLHSIFNDKLDHGFKFAYESMLDAFENHDSEFFQETVEPNLYLKIQRGFEFLESKGLKICQQNKNSQLDIAYNSLEIHNGVHFDRQKNPSGLRKQSLQMFDYAIFNLYTSNDMGASFPFQGLIGRPILQIGLYLSSSRKLYLEDSNGKVVAGENSNINQTHKILFETDPGELSSLGDTQIFNMLRGFQTNTNKEKIFKDIFIGNESQWKITDIDNFMKGNPFTR
ncbi:hypothetical protein ABPG72_007807 [Tetrahymena utriculariae]